MILTVGLSPAQQRILQFDDWSVGDVNRARNVVECGSGKVLNVAVAAHTMGAPVHAITALGGPAGRRIEDELNALGVVGDWIESSVETRTCTTLLSPRRATTELVEECGPPGAEVYDRCRRLVQRRATSAAIVVATGSLPCDAPPDFWNECLANLSAPLLLDLQGPRLLAALVLRPAVVKPNREELAATLGRPLDNETAVRDAARELIAHGARAAVISDGARGLWSLIGDEWRYWPAPQIEVVNPIGCGDSLAAGMAVGLAEGLSLPAAICFGMGAAAHNAELLWPCRLDRGRVEQLSARVTSREAS